MPAKFVEELAKQLVRSNLENFNIMVDEGEIENTATEFSDYGICSENVIDTINHHMEEILSYTHKLQTDVGSILFNE